MKGEVVGMGYWSCSVAHAGVESEERVGCLDGWLGWLLTTDTC